MTIFTLRERLHLAVRRAYENTLYLADSAVERIVSSVIDELQGEVMGNMLLPCGCALELTEDLAIQYETLVQCPGGGDFWALIDPDAPERGRVKEQCQGGRSYVLTRHIQTVVTYDARPITVTAKAPQ